MFTNSFNGTPGNAPSRRRARPLSSENSVTQPKAKRPRNALNEETFVAPNGAPEMEQARPETAVATLQTRPSADISNHLSDLSVRTKKRRVVNDRTSKGDGSTTLVRYGMNCSWYHLLMFNRPPTRYTQLAGFQHCRIAFEPISIVLSMELSTQIQDMPFHSVTRMSSFGRILSTAKLQRYSPSHFPGLRETTMMHFLLGLWYQHQLRNTSLAS